MGKNGMNEKEVEQFVAGILYCVERIDRAMKEKESFERGKRIAKICNELNFLCDQVMNGKLNYSFDKIKRIKTKLSKMELPKMNVEHEFFNKN